MALTDRVPPYVRRLLGPLLSLRTRHARSTLRRKLAPYRQEPHPASSAVHIAYLANSPVPSKAANVVHVMKMCNAFANNGYQITLLAERAQEFHAGEPTRLFDEYGVAGFELCLLERKSGMLKLEIERVREALQRGATHFFGRSLFGSYGAAIAGKPSLLERHLPLKGGELAIATDLFQQPSFRGLIVISRALAQWYERRFPQLKGRIHVVPDAADPPTEGGAAFEFVGMEGASFRVGYAGHLYPGKGAEIIVALAERMPWVGFHVLGGYEKDVAYWQNQTAHLRNIVFYGFRPQRDVSSFLRGLDVVLAPYQRQVTVHGGGEASAWMSPLKIFESMAHAKPIVSSDLPVLREVLTHEHNALLCDPDDLDAWVASIERLRADHGVASALARTANAEFLGNHSWKRRAQRIIAMLVDDQSTARFRRRTASLD